MNDKFHKAQDRLYEELDLLKLVRKLRIASLLAKAKLNDRNLRMIDHFNRYCIKDQDDSSASDENDQTSIKQIQSLTINHADSQALGNFKYDQISYFGIPKHQKKFLSALGQYKFSNAQIKSVRNWLLQVGDLMKLQQMTKDFQSDLIQDKPLDMTALRELSGVKKIDEAIIQKTNQELNQEIDIIWQKVKEFADSKEGEMCIKRLMPNFGYQGGEDEIDMGEQSQLDIQSD